jgi:hypothetical protein
MATNQEIEKALRVLSAAYPRFELPEATISIYQRLLSDLDFDLLKAATLQCASMCTFFPTVAEIRNAAVEVITMSEGIPSASEAWGEIVRMMGTVGRGKYPQFSHPFIEQVVDDFGWSCLCLSENAISDRARVIDAYEKIVKKSLREKQMLPEVLSIIGKRLEDRPAQVKQIAMVMEEETPREIIPMPDHVKERLDSLFVREHAR